MSAANTNALVVRSQTVALADHIGSDEWREAVRNTICRGASDAVLTVFGEVCRRTGLDPFARQIYLVERRVKLPNGEWGVTYQPQTSIDGFRVVAHRSKQYAGQEEPLWCGQDGKWVNVWLSTTPPAAAKIGVLRHDFDKPMWAIAKYAEYVQTTRDGNANSMWAKMPANQLSKCAEALALRKAFPQDLSGLYTAEEMGQAANEDPTTSPPPAPVNNGAPRRGGVSRVADKLRQQQGPRPDADPPHEEPEPQGEGPAAPDDFDNVGRWFDACDAVFQERKWTPERADWLYTSCLGKLGLPSWEESTTAKRREFYTKLSKGDFDHLKVHAPPAPSAASAPAPGAAPVDDMEGDPVTAPATRGQRAAATRRGSQRTAAQDLNGEE